MDECELIMLVSTVACTLSKCCSTDELNILSVVFTQLGDSLATILAKRQLCETTTTDNAKSNMIDNHNIYNIKNEKDY